MIFMRAAGCRLILSCVALVVLVFGGARDAFADPPPAQHSDIAVHLKNPTARALVDQANNAYRSGNLRLAMILLRQATKASPQEPIIHLWLGRLLVRMNFAIAAEPELRQAQRGGVSSDLVLPVLFQAMLAQHHEQKLLDEFSDPGLDAKGSVSADILKARAQALAALGRTADAAAAMDRSLSLRRDVSGILVRAQIAIQQGNSALAKSLTDEALKLDPHDGQAMNAKVRMLMDANDNAAALALNEQMVRQFPKELGVRLTRIELLQALKQDDKATAEMETVIAMTRGSAVARFYEAVILARKDKKAAWRMAQSLPPEFVRGQTVALQVSDMAIRSGFVESGASILSAAIIKSPDALALRLRLASLRLDQNSPELALSVLAPVKDSADPRVLDLLAQAYLNSGKDAEGFALLDRMQPANPNGVIEHLKRAHGARPTDSEITFHLVRALDASGNRNAAKALLKSLLDSDTNFQDLDDARKLGAAWHLSG